MTGAFESALFLVRQTKSDLERFKSIANEWVYEGGYTTVIEKDPQTGNHVYKLRLARGPMPEELRGIANNALNNLRHAFDQAACAVFSVSNNGAEAPERFYFPFANCPNDLNGRLKQPNFTNFPEAALDAIREIQPYPTGLGHEGGNDLFAIYCGASGRNKHRTTAHLNATIRKLTSDGITGTNVIRLNMPPIWDVAHSEMIVGITAPDGELYYDLSISPEITFGDAGKLTGAAIYTTALTIAAWAEILIGKLDATLPR